MTDVAALRRQAETWLEDDPDQESQAELRALLERDDADSPESVAELADRFAGPLTFGTAGLRGPVRAGPNGMNRAVVRAAAAGLVAYLDDHRVPGPVVVGYDARRGSAAFAAETAAVVTGAGRAALRLPRPLPTPVLAHAVRAYSAAAGVMVTASHNPPADNGYKVYLADGAQLVPPADAEIESAIRAVGPLSSVPLGDGGATLGEDAVDAYVAAVAGLVHRHAPRDLAVAYTPLHGVGRALLLAAFARAGFPPPRVVAEQAEPDPAFPTVAFPNPEEPGAADLLLALARETGADLALAHDPDADRCAVAVPEPAGAWRMLTGDELGVLLADHLVRRGARGTFATTIVSSSLLGKLAAARGMAYAETLTGFKWIVRAAEGTDLPPLAYGYEEALGYACAPEIVRDKDGISAALLTAEMAATAKAEGVTLLDRLDALAAEFGLYATGQLAVRVDDVAEIDVAMRRLRGLLPRTLLGRPVVEARDLLPTTDAVTIRAEGVRVVVRPSGTEPKLKAYLEVIEPTETGRVAEARAAAERRLRTLRAEVAATLGVPG